MTILILGGTGFIGYHAVLEFLNRGHRVTVLSLPPLPEQDLFPPEVEVVLADVNELSDAELLALFKTQDAAVFAAGADDRHTPKAPAYDFFYRANVESPTRFFALARQAGVKRGVLLGSYFSYFDRILPGNKLSELHPYIRSRREQATSTLQAALPRLELMILELPYIFGAMPGRMPLWAPLIKYITLPLPLFYSRGGTNAIGVKQVGEAIAGALEKGVAGESYLVGDENLTWAELLYCLSRLAGKNKKVITLPDAVVKVILLLIHLLHKFQGKEAGVNLREFTELQTMNAFFDPAPAREALGYAQGGLNEALRETVAACLHK